MSPASGTDKSHDRKGPIKVPNQERKLLGQGMYRTISGWQEDNCGIMVKSLGLNRDENFLDFPDPDTNKTGHSRGDEMTDPNVTIDLKCSLSPRPIDTKK